MILKNINVFHSINVLISIHMYEYEQYLKMIQL